jgi:hypothetical protein
VGGEAVIFHGHARFTGDAGFIYGDGRADLMAGNRQPYGMGRPPIGRWNNSDPR